MTPSRSAATLTKELAFGPLGACEVQVDANVRMPLPEDPMTGLPEVLTAIAFADEGSDDPSWETPCWELNEYTVPSVAAIRSNAGDAAIAETALAGKGATGDQPVGSSTNRPEEVPA